MMYALCDVNGMYSACEKVFDPAIRRKPVVVLSNNDSNIVAVCSLAKRLGVKKFLPYFQVKDMLAQMGAVVRSSNYELYASLSADFHSVCAQFAPEQHVYSIDESFLRYWDGYMPQKDWFEHGRDIRRTVWRHVRLPIGVGIGPTPTLAKAANHASKRITGFNGVAVIDSEPARQAILEQMMVTDVWGIGSRLGASLNALGVQTAWQLANLPPRKARQQFNVTVEATVHELNGRVMLQWDDIRPAKQQIYSTRSFGQRVEDLPTLKEAVATHVHTAASKLRRQGSLCGVLTVFAGSSPHDAQGHYSKSLSVNLAAYSADTTVLLAHARQLIAAIYRPGVRFYKCGVGLLDIVDGEQHQPDLFQTNEDNPQLMACLDEINKRYGRGTLFCASQGVKKEFEMRRQFLSPRYTTKLSDLPVIKC